MKEHLDRHLPGVPTETHNRRSIRLKGYDYSTPGYYFVTVCTQDRARVLGSIQDGVVNLTPAGEMVSSVWNEIPTRYPGVEVDAFVIMPDHIHGIIVMTETGPGGEMGRPRETARPQETARPRETGRPRETARPREKGRTQEMGRTQETGRTQEMGRTQESGRTQETGRTQEMGRTQESGRPRGAAPTTVGDVMHRFKSLTTSRYMEGVRTLGWPTFRGRLWQRNYYERIVRDENELNAIRQYIANNPVGAAPRGRPSPNRPEFPPATPSIPPHDRDTFPTDMSCPAHHTKGGPA